MNRLYLDYAATTPVLPEVVEAMLPWLSAEFGNPSSLYAEGRKAKDAIDRARELVSHALDCLFAEVIFTSSGTEAANLAIGGAALANEDPKRNRILFSAVEHHCVLNTEPVLRQLGYQVEIIPVDRIGRIQTDALQEMLSDDVLLVSVMHANNELGTIQPIEEISKLVHSVGALYHCDAVQTFLALEDINPATLADLVTISAHKIYGPKGAGALFIKAGTKIKPVTAGGGQERELRAGTENVAAIAGFGEAVRLLPNLLDTRAVARDRFLNDLNVPNLMLSVPNQADQLPGHAHIRIPGIQAETMLILLDRMGLSASSGAACSSGSIEPSHVLLACGYSEEQAKEGLRFTFGRKTSVDEAAQAAHFVNRAAEKLLDK